MYFAGIYRSIKFKNKTANDQILMM